MISRNLFSSLSEIMGFTADIFKRLVIGQRNNVKSPVERERERERDKSLNISDAPKGFVIISINCFKPNDLQTHRQV